MIALLVLPAFDRPHQLREFEGAPGAGRAADVRERTISLDQRRAALLHEEPPAPVTEVPECRAPRVGQYRELRAEEPRQPLRALQRLGEQHEQGAVVGLELRSDPSQLEGVEDARQSRVGAHEEQDHPLLAAELRQPHALAGMGLELEVGGRLPRRYGEVMGGGQGRLPRGIPHRAASRRTGEGRGAAKAGAYPRPAAGA